MNTLKLSTIVLPVLVFVTSCGDSKPQDTSADKRDFMAACSQNIDEATEIDEASQYDNERIIDICQCVIDDMQAPENAESLMRVNAAFKEDPSAALPKEALRVLALCTTEELNL